MHQVDAVAKEPHYYDHISAVWCGLPDDLRGTFYVSPEVSRSRSLCDKTEVVAHLPPSGNTTLVASWVDLKKCQRSGRGAIYMEHGAGQTYVGITNGANSYVGGNRDGVLGVLVPGEAARQQQIAAHPHIPVFIVGCPKLDKWHKYNKFDAAQPVPALAYHWNCRVAPETLSAWRHFRPGWKAVKQSFGHPIGHAHPRIWQELSQVYRHEGFKPEPLFDNVIAQADVLAVDNSSVLFEFAALDRPVVVMNAPQYRKNVHHGGRFWDWADVGIQVDLASGLSDAFVEALEDSPEQQEIRRKIIAEIYGVPVGHATAAAVSAVLEIIESARCT